MNKKALIAGFIAIAGLLVAYLGSTWWAGKSAETTLTKQHKLIADLPYFVIKSRDYQRGFFSSTERTTIALNPGLLESYGSFLKFGDQPLPKFELSYVQHIKHGPLPLLGQGRFTPLKAAVTTDIEFTEESKKLLGRFFGDQKPLQLENQIRFNEDGVFTLKVPSFNYEEALSKVKSTWGGLEASIVYGGDFNKVDILAKAPSFKLEAGPKGTFELKNLAFEAHNTRGTSGLMLGTGKFTLDQLTAHIAELPKPMDIQLDTLVYVAQSNASGDFLNATAEVNLKSLTLNGKVYGPAVLALEANHLHAPTLAKLNKELTAIQKAFPDPAVQGPKMLAMLRKEGTPLLKNDPALALKNLSVKLPEGDLRLKANLSIKGFVDKDLDQPLEILNKMHAKVELSLPKKVIETYVLWQARDMIATDTTDGERPDTEDLDNLARNLMENQIKKLVQQKLIRVEGDSLASTAEWKQGQLTVNQTVVPLPFQRPVGEGLPPTP